MISNASPNADTSTSAIVTRVFTHDRVAVRTGDAEHHCTLAPALAQPPDPIDRIVIGDRVILDDGSTGSLRAVQVAARTSVIARRAAGKRDLPQPLAANATHLLCVMSCAQPKPSWNLLDRMLVLAETAGVIPIIVVTKADLADMPALEAAMAHYHALYPVHFVSTETGGGIEGLRAALAEGMGVMLGKSGVGKSSLLNALVPGAGGAIAPLGRKSKKGCHTTTTSALLPLGSDPGGGLIADTPGLRELALWNVGPADLARAFCEFRRHLEGCRFGVRCTHVHEIGCAVRGAVESGAIDPRRYRAYLRILGAPESHDITPRAGARAHTERHNERPSHDPHEPSTGFRCVNCDAAVPASTHGTHHRNHCPRCLWSLHLDLRPGDRAAACNGPMQPIAVWAKDAEEWSLVHRCTRCGALATTRIGPDDNPAALIALAARPLAKPPFPLDTLTEARV